MNLSQILVFTERIEFKTLLEVECKGLTGINPVFNQFFDDFKSMLSILGSVEILIIDEPQDKTVFQSLIDEVKSKEKMFKKVFLLSDDKTLLKEAKIFGKNDIESMISDLKIYLKPAKNEIGYISIPIDSLIHFKVLPFDLFVKIGDNKFVKRIPAHEEIDSNTFASFLQKGITELYFEKQYNRDFSLMLINNMINKVEQEYDSLEKKLEATSDVYNTTYQIVSKLGFKPRVVEVCESVLNQISEDVTGGKDNFAKFLEQLRTQTELSFNYRLMELTSFIATQIIDDTENEQLKREKIRAIVFSAMFCDYSLTSSTQIHIRKSEQLAKLPANEQKIINDHAHRSATLVEQYQNAPMESSLIIKQHHGSMTGVGFPKEISSKLLSSTKCLMTAQEVAYQILVDNYRHPIDVLSDVKLNFIDTPLEDYFEIFESTCLKNLTR